MVKRIINWEYYTISGVITVIVLLAGIYFGVFVSKEKVDALQNELDNLKMEQDDLNLEFTFVSLSRNQSCNIISYELDKTIDNAAKLGDKVTSYETSEKVKDSRFIYLKKDYTLTLIKYWFYLDKMRQECNKTNFTTILFFYSNENCPDCNSQGIILSYLKQTYPQNAMVFAFDSNIDLNVVDLLKKNFEVVKTPTLIIDNKKYEGLVSLDTLKKIVCKDVKLCS